MVHSHIKVGKLELNCVVRKACNTHYLPFIEKWANPWTNAAEQDWGVLFLKNKIYK